MIRKYAPWTPEEVENLKAFQAFGYVHPFTCGGKDCGADLIASEAGWACPRCDYRQDWCHEYMCDGTIKRHMEFLEKSP